MALLTQPLWIAAASSCSGNSPVGIKLHPAKGGAQIQAEALVIDGRIIPIQHPLDLARPLQQLAVLSKLN